MQNTMENWYFWGEGAEFYISPAWNVNDKEELSLLDFDRASELIGPSIETEWQFKACLISPTSEYPMREETIIMHLNSEALNMPCVYALMKLHDACLAYGGFATFEQWVENVGSALYEKCYDARDREYIRAYYDWLQQCHTKAQSVFADKYQSFLEVEYIK